MSGWEQKLDDDIAAGRLTIEDADAVHTFAQFLRESGPAPAVEDGRRAFPPGHPLHDPDARRAYTARWMPYLQGEADGPVVP